MSTPRTRPQRTITPVIHPGDVEYAVRADIDSARWLVIYRFTNARNELGMWRDSDIQPTLAEQNAGNFPSTAALRLAAALAEGVNP